MDGTDTIATNQRMHQWYLIQGDTLDEICLLNQRWGSFISNSTLEVEYATDKEKLCDENNKLLVTLPLTTDITDGYYSIDTTVGTGFHFMNSAGSEIRTSAGTGVFHITGHLRTTFHIKSVSTGLNWNINNGALEASAGEDQWHLIKKDNELYCLQETLTRLYVKVAADGVISLTSSCNEGIFDFTRYHLSDPIENQNLVRYYANPDSDVHTNVGIFDLQQTDFNHESVQRVLNSEYLEMEGEDVIEIGKTTDNWLILQPYQETASDKWCLVERDSGMFLDFGTQKISYVEQCGGQYDFKSVHVRNDVENFATLVNPDNNQYLTADAFSNTVNIGAIRHLWRFTSTQD